MLVLPDAVPNEYETAPTGSLGQIEIPGAGKKHGEVVVFTPEQRRAVDDALRGYLGNYEAAWRTGQIDDYYLFPGSKMRLLDKSGRRWTRRVRADVKPLSRDGARIAFKELEAIARVDHVEGRGWYGLRRIAADLAESATTDDRVKDRLGGWQDSETRKQIYQDRQTDELRAEAAKVRRELRLGAKPQANSRTPPVDLDALLATLTPEQQALLAAKINAPTGPGAGPTTKSPGPVRIPATGLLPTQELPESGRWDSNPRRPAWEGGRKTSADRTTRQVAGANAMFSSPAGCASSGGGAARTCAPVAIDVST
jgi:hypothetical protein